MKTTDPAKLSLTKSKHKDSSSPASSKKLAAKLEKKAEKLRKLIKKAKSINDPAQQAAIQQLLLEKLCRVADKLESVSPSTSAAAPSPVVDNRQAVIKLNPYSSASKQRSSALSTAEDFARRSLRQQRFSNQSEISRNEQVLLDHTGGTGTSEALEKEYLRLTSLPLASNVRPAHILAKALKLVQAKWKDNASYSYACEQLKSIRQDLTVQHIRDTLAVQVYETHARIAIEVSDWSEFKQCLGMLKQLYAEGQQGNAAEFAAYGLMLAAQHGPDLYSRELAQLPAELLRHSCVQHAVAVCWAYRAGQARMFNNLYPSAVRMAGYVMDEMLGRVRAVGLRALLVAFHPTPVPLEYVASELGFEDEGEVVEYLRGCGVVVDSRSGVVDTKASRAAAAGPPRPR